MSLEEAVKGFPKEHINKKAKNVPYTFWHLLEHVRITQWDILDFCVNPDYKYIKWPDDYWPKKEAMTDWKGWQKTIREFNRDLGKLKKLVKDPKTDFYKKIPRGEGQNILREILTVADHNAYHIGEFAILRQVENIWSKNEKK